MPELQRYSRTAKIAKFLIPAASRVLSSGRIQLAVSLGETGAALLQGKGAGSGWDLNAEVTAALKFIRPGAMVFDVGANKGECPERSGSGWATYGYFCLNRRRRAPRIWEWMALF